MTGAKALLLVCLAVFLTRNSLAADKKEVIEIDRPGEHSVSIGQPIHFIVRYDGVSGKVFTDLEVAIDGKKIEKPTVESRPDPKMVDVGQVVFVYRAGKAGTFRITVTPMTRHSKGKPREFVLKVNEKK